MRTHYFLAMIICIGLLAPAMARAEDTAGVFAPPGLKYFPDPAYKRLNADDPPPMAEMVDLANQGDTRAMFILGDMSEKGKGGLEQDRKQAQHWFEESAKHGYNQSFIRLAAMAKHDNNPQVAWQWYTLAIDSGDTQAYAIRARKTLVESAKLSSDDIDKARKAMEEWKDVRDKQLRAEKDVVADKERLQKEQVEKDAKAANDANNEQAKVATKAQQDKKPDNNPGQQENDNEQN